MYLISLISSNDDALHTRTYFSHSFSTYKFITVVVSIMNEHVEWGSNSRHNTHTYFEMNSVGSWLIFFACFFFVCFHCRVYSMNLWDSVYGSRTCCIFVLAYSKPSHADVRSQRERERESINNANHFLCAAVANRCEDFHLSAMHILEHVLPSNALKSL